MDQWGNLPPDLLMKIEERLILYVDKVRISSVCRSWRNGLPKLPNHKQLQLLPLLLVPCDESSQSSYALLNILDNKTYHLELQKTRGMMFRGSSSGWVVTLEGTHSICLINPLTKAKIKLPPRSKFPDVKDFCAGNLDNEYVLWDLYDGVFSYSSTRVKMYFTDKIILSSSSSSSDDFVAVALYGEFSRLAYWKRGDEKWTFLYGYRRPYQDAIFYKGKLHALSKNGILELIDIHPCPRVKRLTSEIKLELFGLETYLVESSIGLLMVRRHRNTGTNYHRKNKGYPYRTSKFLVFKFLRKQRNWCRVTDIGDNVLFIGFNTSVSKSSLDFPGLKGNSIYFTDNAWVDHYDGIQGGVDIGVFQLESERIEPFTGFKCEGNLVWPPPIWVIPSP